MNAREAYELCGLLAEMCKESEAELTQFVAEHGDYAMGLLNKIGASIDEGSLELKDDSSVMAACTVIQLSRCFEKLSKEEAGAKLARDN